MSDPTNTPPSTTPQYRHWPVASSAAIAAKFNFYAGRDPILIEMPPNSGMMYVRPTNPPLSPGEDAPPPDDDSIICPPICLTFKV